MRREVIRLLYTESDTGSSPVQGTKFLLVYFIKAVMNNIARTRPIMSLSRGTSIDTEKCVEKIGSRFDLVIVAAIRARELAHTHRKAENPGQLNAPVQALLDIQEGRVGKEYLRKVR